MATSLSPSPRAGAVLLAACLSFYGALVGLPALPAHELHLVLGGEVFGPLLSANWDSGQALAVHPPLVHLLLGLLARLPGLALDRAWALLLAAGAPLLVFGAGRLGEALGGVRAGDACAWLFAVNPLVYQALLVDAQLPLTAAAAAALLAASQWASGLRPLRAGLGAAALGIACATAHPAGPVMLGALAVVVFFARRGWGRGEGLVIGGSLAVALGLSLWALAPVLGALERLRAAQQGAAFAAGPISIFATAAAAALLARGPRAARLTGGAALGCFFALATHPGRFRADEAWLWGELACALLALGLSLGARPLPRPAMGLGAGALALACAALVAQPSAVGARRYAGMAEVIAAVGGSDGPRFRHLTLGLGEARFELARRAGAPSLDGVLPWLPPRALQAAGLPWTSLDGLPLAVPEARAVLAKVLAEAGRSHLRWVVCANEGPAPLLEAAGFIARSTWAGGLTLFEHPGLEPLPPTAPAAPAPLPWILVPLGSALLGALSLLRRPRAPGAARG